MQNHWQHRWDWRVAALTCVYIYIHMFAEAGASWCALLGLVCPDCLRCTYLYHFNVSVTQVSWHVPRYRQFQKAICKQPKLEVQVLLGSSSPPSPPRQHGFQNKAGRPDSHWAHRDLQGPFQLEMVLEALHRPIWGLNFQEGIILGRARAAWQDHGEIPDLEQSTVWAFPAYLGVKMNFIFFLVFLFWAWVVFPCSCSCLLSSWSSQLGLF